jgi:hypothetical protein
MALLFDWLIELALIVTAPTALCVPSSPIRMLPAALAAERISPLALAPAASSELLPFRVMAPRCDTTPPARWRYRFPA